MLSSIVVHALKGARGIAHATAMVTPIGLAFDRRWMLVDDAGDFVSQRIAPSLRHIEAHGDARGLHLVWRGTQSTVSPSHIHVPLPSSTDDVVEVTVWDDRVRASSCGHDARLWLDAHLGHPYDLVALASDRARPMRTSRVRPGAHVSFADGYPFLIANEASLRDLESRAGLPFAMERFRPNLVVDGLEAWEEDELAVLRIGEVTFDLVKPCVRCEVTTLDPDGGPAGKEPLATLATFRRDPEGGVTFGVNAVARGEGRVHVGDRVEVLERRA